MVAVGGCFLRIYRSKQQARARMTPPGMRRCYYGGILFAKRAHAPLARIDRLVLESQTDNYQLILPASYYRSSLAQHCADLPLKPLLSGDSCARALAKKQEAREQRRKRRAGRISQRESPDRKCRY